MKKNERQTVVIKAAMRDLSYETLTQTDTEIALDQDAVQRIYACTLRRVGLAEQEGGASSAARHSHRHMAWKRPTAAVAAVLLACGLSVGSIAAAGGLFKTFGQYFHTLSEAHYEKQLFHVNKSASDNGVTVTVTQALCDGRALYVIERVELAPAAGELTDAMFTVDEYGGYPFAPYWGYDTLINVRRTGEEALQKGGTVAERMPGFSRLLEHDAHSMTWLRVYGSDDDFSAQTDDFFTDGRQFVLHYADVENLGDGEEKTVTCRLDIPFEMKKTAAPQCYTLPEEVYARMSNRTGDGMADMIINPWYMRFSGAGVSGKVLDPAARREDAPAIEVVMKDGTSYTERHGISMYRDYLGKDFNALAAFRCDFDTPVDIAEIASVRVYGYEMKRGIQAADKAKEKPFARTDGTALPAATAAGFPTAWKMAAYERYGNLRYRVRGVKVYDNAYAIGAKSEDDLLEVQLRWDENVHDWDDEKWNHQTGQLGEDMLVLEYEVEMTNIDAAFTESLGTFDYNGTDYMGLGLFGLRLRNDLMPSDDWGDVLYIRENEYDVTGQLHDIRLAKGETRTFHVSFAVQDNHAGALEEVHFQLGGDKTQETCLNLRKIVNESINSEKSR